MGCVGGWVGARAVEAVIQPSRSSVVADASLALQLASRCSSWACTAAAAAASCRRLHAACKPPGSCCLFPLHAHSQPAAQP